MESIKTAIALTGGRSLNLLNVRTGPPSGLKIVGPLLKIRPKK